MEFTVPLDAASVSKQIVELGLPQGSLIVLINRNNEFVVPSGGTALEAGGKMFVLTNQESLAEVRSIVEIRQTAAKVV